MSGIQGVMAPGRGPLWFLLRGREFQSGVPELMTLDAKFYVHVFFCGKEDTSFFKMSMSPKKVMNHCNGIYTHVQVALEGT